MPFKKGVPQGAKPGARTANNARLKTKAIELRAKKAAPMREIKPVSDIKEIIVTPEHAARLLEANTNNRPVRDEMVMRYARDMMAGRWKRNGATIVIAAGGTILDGQHRLWAIVEAGKPISLLVMENADPDVIMTIDTGTARTMGDVFAIKKIGHSGTMAGAFRWWYWYRNQRDRKKTPSRYTHPEIMALYESMPQVHEAIHSSAQFTSASRIVGPSLFAFMFSGASLFDRAKAEEWAAALDSGANLSGMHPAFSLREKLMGMRMNRTKLAADLQAAYTMKSWNAFVQGKSYKHYRMNTGESFPEFYGVKKL